MSEVLIKQPEVEGKNPYELIAGIHEACLEIIESSKERRPDRLRHTHQGETEDKIYIEGEINGEPVFQTLGRCKNDHYHLTTSFLDGDINDVVTTRFGRSTDSRKALHQINTSLFNEVVKEDVEGL